MRASGHRPEHVRAGPQSPARGATAEEQVILAGVASVPEPGHGAQQCARMARARPAARPSPHRENREAGRPGGGIAVAHAGAAVAANDHAPACSGPE